MSGLDLEWLRSGMRECPSDYALDRLHVQEIGEAEREELRMHVRACPRCGDRMAERGSGFAGTGVDDVEALWDAIRAQGDRSPRPVSRWTPRVVRSGTFAGVLAVAAALVVGFLPTSQRGLGPAGSGASLDAEPARDAMGPASAHERPRTVRAKGDLALRVHRKRGAGSEEAQSGDHFEAGDTLRFEVFLPEPGHVRVLGQEADGTLYEAWPQSPTQSTWFGAAGAKLLPGAVQLDASAGRETLYALLCPGAIEDRRCSSAGPDAEPRCAEACQVTRFVLEKGAQ